ncbi:biofilm regulation phosphoprotein SiaC [Paraburkholderia sp. J76]|uniref:biofilm regulation phosphoprotein SiaC n=1 Tax=Paraburkholderia sp. J76 TaxID=2805439 RepID=UPI002ABDF5C9|nr:biofilm regulation phosphoprotein SiaC [Paraburkholderia sp. J76]
MNDLAIRGTQSTPSIDGNWKTGVLAMRGDSYPENSYELFDPLIVWVKSYLAQEERPLYIELRLLYLNTSSIKAMMDIFDLLEKAHGSGRAVRVNWYYDHGNERVAELAGEFREDCTFPFEIQMCDRQAI